MSSIQDVLYKNLGRHNLGKLDDVELTDEVKEAIKDYAKEKCKEQREIIAEFDWISNTGHGSEQVLNAPEPEFE